MKKEEISFKKKTENKILTTDQSINFEKFEAIEMFVKSD